jgi:hypothetical protein
MIRFLAAACSIVTRGGCTRYVWCIVRCGYQWLISTSYVGDSYSGRCENLGTDPLSTRRIAREGTWLGTCAAAMN